MTPNHSIAAVTAILLGLALFVPLDAAMARQDAAGTASEPEIQKITIALFDLEVGKGVDIEAKALTDQISVQLAAMPKVKIVNREEMRLVANEQRMSLSGLVDDSAAVKLGAFLSAQQVIVGRASRVGQSFFLVLKLIDVETTEQSVVSVQTPIKDGIPAFIEQIQPKLATTIRFLQNKVSSLVSDDVSDAVRKHAKFLNGKVVLVSVDERHVSRPLRDPAAGMAVSHRLSALGVTTIIPAGPVSNWKQNLLETGRFGEQAVDFLLEGDGISSYAAEVEGLISCRARVELRLVATPGRTAIAVEKGVGAKVDLVEALAAKAALEDAAVHAFDALMARVYLIGEKGNSSNPVD